MTVPLMHYRYRIFLHNSTHIRNKFKKETNKRLKCTFLYANFTLQMWEGNCNYWYFLCVIRQILVLSFNVETNATMVFTVVRRFEFAISSIWLHYMNQPYRGEMVSVLDPSAVKLGSSSGRVKPDYKIGICCFSVKHTALRRKIKYWLARNQNNVSVWSDMSTPLYLCIAMVYWEIKIYKNVYTRRLLF